MTIKLWGYSLSRFQQEPMELAEVTLAATPAQLRKIARFIESAADGLEKHGSNFGHEHLAHAVPEFEGAPEFIILNPQNA
jgi:hypothetical protein